MDKWATNGLQSVSCLKVRILVCKFNETFFIKNWASDIRTFRQKMYMDSPMETLTKNDGIISLMHCQEWNFVQVTFRLEFKNSCCHCPPHIQIYLGYVMSHNLCEKFTKSWNVNCITNALLTRFSKLNWNASFIQALTMVKNIHVENRLDWKNWSHSYFTAKNGLKANTIELPIEVSEQRIENFWPRNADSLWNSEKYQSFEPQT